MSSCMKPLLPVPASSSYTQTDNIASCCLVRYGAMQCLRVLHQLLASAMTISAAHAVKGGALTVGALDKFTSDR